MNKTKTSLAIATTLLLAVTGLAHADPAIEASSDDTDRGGVKLGLSVANLDLHDGAYTTDWGSKAGLAVGGYFQIHLGRNLSLQPELGYSSKGAALHGSEAAGSLHAGVDLAYLESALLVSGRMPRPGRVEPFYFAGPYVGLLLDAESWSQSGFDDRESESIEDEVATYDLGVTVGGGVRLPAWGRGLTFEVRYQRGLVNINEAPGFDAEEALAVNNRAVDFLVGVTF